MDLVGFGISSANTHNRLDTITKETLASSLDEKSSPDVDAVVWGNSDSSESQADEPATPQGQ